MTLVHNMSTGEERLYDLEPEAAVVAAYEQEHGNYNTWDYPDFGDHPKSIRGIMTVGCGDWVATKIELVTRENIAKLKGEKAIVS